VNPDEPEPATGEQENIALHTAAAKLAGADGIRIKPASGEWTVEHGRLHDTIIAGDIRIRLPLAFEQSDKIVNAHKAELDAERKRTEEFARAQAKANARLCEIESEHQQQLAAERKMFEERYKTLRDGSDTEIQQLRAQLAAAQAAIGDSYRLVATQQSPNDLRVYELNSEDPCGYATPVKLDTAALTAAIAEAQKRYIDALKLVKSIASHDVQICAIIDGVLP
jgi:multidrug efflux pump subunit AcrA (membrane-fusion protein)